MRRTNFATTIQVAVAALAVALALVVALPAKAYDSKMSFGLTIGSSMFFQDPELAVCYTDFQVRKAMQGAGYSDVSVNAPSDDYVQVRATRDGMVYLVKFNRCTGSIEETQALNSAG